MTERPDDTVPSTHDLLEVGREVVPHPPRPPGWFVDAVLRWLGRGAVVVFGLAVAVQALPGVHFLGHGRPPLFDVVGVAAVFAAIGATYAPVWRWLAGGIQLVPFTVAVFSLDVALLRVIDVLAGERFTSGNLGELAAAAALTAVPTAVLGLVADAVATPDPMPPPD